MPTKSSALSGCLALMKLALRKQSGVFQSSVQRFRGSRIALDLAARVVRWPCDETSSAPTSIRCDNHNCDGWNSPAVTRLQADSTLLGSVDTRPWPALSRPSWSRMPRSSRPFEPSNNNLATRHSAVASATAAPKSVTRMLSETTSETHWELAIQDCTRSSRRHGMLGESLGLATDQRSFTP